MNMTVAQMLATAEPTRIATLKARNRLGFNVATQTCATPIHFDITLVLERKSGSALVVKIRSAVHMNDAPKAIDALTENDVLAAISEAHMKLLDPVRKLSKTAAADCALLLARYQDTNYPKNARVGWLHPHTMEAMIACRCTPQRAEEIVNDACVDWSEMSTAEIHACLRAAAKVFA